MAGALEKIGKEFKVPGNIAVLIILALMPFVKSGLVSWAGTELKPIIKAEVIAQVEVTVDSLNVKQERFHVEQQAQKAQMDTVKIWVKEMKESAEADTAKAMTKEDFKALMLEALQEANGP